MSHSDFTSNIDLSRISIEVTSIEDSIDRAQYSSMKECLKCKTALGKTGAKKFFCYFCYKAICAGCSAAEVLHPETRKLQKMCFPCFIHNTKLQVLKVGAEFVTFRLAKEIEEKEKLILKRLELNKELNELKEMRVKTQAEMNFRIVERQKVLNEEQEKFRKCNEEFEEVKAKYDLNSNKSAPQTAHRGGDCMKCEVF